MMLKDKLTNIKTKTLIVAASEDIYFTPEFDAYPLEDVIENLEIFFFDAIDFVFDEVIPSL